MKLVKFQPTSAKCRNTVAKRTQHVAPNNVAICCVGMLRSFGRGLKLMITEIAAIITSLDSEAWIIQLVNRHFKHCWLCSSGLATYTKLEFKIVIFLMEHITV